MGNPETVKAEWLSNQLAPGSPVPACWKLPQQLFTGANSRAQISESKIALPLGTTPTTPMASVPLFSSLLLLLLPRSVLPTTTAVLLLLLEWPLMQLLLLALLLLATAAATMLPVRLRQMAGHL